MSFVKDFSCFRAAPDGEELIYVSVCPAVPPVVCHWQDNLLSFGDSCQIVVMALTPFYMIAMSHCHRLHLIKIVLHACVWLWKSSGTRFAAFPPMDPTSFMRRGTRYAHSIGKRSVWSVLIGTSLPSMAPFYVRASEALFETRNEKGSIWQLGRGERYTWVGM